MKLLLCKLSLSSLGSGTCLYTLNRWTRKVTISKRPFLRPFTSSFEHLIALEKAHFCSNVSNGIHVNLSVKLSNTLSV